MVSMVSFSAYPLGARSAPGAAARASAAGQASANVHFGPEKLRFPGPKCTFARR